jgi:hypothetical protein
MQVTPLGDSPFSSEIRLNFISSLWEYELKGELRMITNAKQAALKMDFILFMNLLVPL